MECYDSTSDADIELFLVLLSFCLPGPAIEGVAGRRLPYTECARLSSPLLSRGRVLSSSMVSIRCPGQDSSCSLSRRLENTMRDLDVTR